jgi:hypothetical protein
MTKFFDDDDFVFENLCQFMISTECVRLQNAKFVSVLVCLCVC